MKILVTGCVGFIGFHLCESLLNNKNIEVLGVDNLNSYYSIKLKKLRLSLLKKKKKFKFYKIDISNCSKLETIFKKNKFDIIINLAAQAGVRYSIINPIEYVSSNILGFSNILDLSKKYKIQKLFYASSSSVYGDQKGFPIKENRKLSPKNMYSLSKKNNEEIAEIYSDHYGIKTVGLRFFTVYGEWGRPDMLMLKYMMAKMNDKVFIINNKGNHYRDFTYIGDVIKILIKLIFSKMKKKHEVFNICSNNPMSVKFVLNRINELFGKPKIKFKKKLKIEVYKTHGDNTKIKKITGFKKFTDIETGLLQLVNWSKKHLKKI
jgi:UDP-glucuronate 4-epimerase